MVLICFDKEYMCSNFIEFIRVFDTKNAVVTACYEYDKKKPKSFKIKCDFWGYK